MIQDEVQGIMESRKKKPLFEQGVDPMTVNMKVVDEVLSEKFDGMIDQQVSRLMDEFMTTCTQVIVKAINQHAIAGAVNVTYRELRDEFSTNSDVIDDHQRECFENIRRSLQEYASAMASEAVILVGSTDYDNELL